MFDPSASQAQSLGGGQVWPTTIFLNAKHQITYLHEGAYPTLQALRQDSDHYAQSPITMIAAITSDPANGVGVLAAVAAGAISFLSPCMLPLVPGYLSAVVGVAAADVRRAKRRRVMVPSLLFVTSFSLIFVLLGVGATLFGQGLAAHRQRLHKIAAALIIALGVLSVASIFVVCLNREWHVDALLQRAGRHGGDRGLGRGRGPSLLEQRRRGLE